MSYLNSSSDYVVTLFKRTLSSYSIPLPSSPSPEESKFPKNRIHSGYDCIPLTNPRLADSSSVMSLSYETSVSPDAEMQLGPPFPGITIFMTRNLLRIAPCNSESSGHI